MEGLRTGPWRRSSWFRVQHGFRRMPANHVNVYLCSLRQRRGERGHVHPRKPSERGHPTQLHQHLQRRWLLLHNPSCLRSIHWCPRIKPEHRGEPATEEHGPGPGTRQLMALQSAAPPREGVCSQLQFGASFPLSYLFSISPLLLKTISLQLMKTKEQAL